MDWKVLRFGRNPRGSLDRSHGLFLAEVYGFGSHLGSARRMVWVDLEGLLGEQGFRIEVSRCLRKSLPFGMFCVLRSGDYFIENSRRVKRFC